MRLDLGLDFTWFNLFGEYFNTPLRDGDWTNNLCHWQDNLDLNLGEPKGHDLCM